jgi:hypothetical protein
LRWRFSIFARKEILMLNQSDPNPHEKRDIDENIDRINRRHRWLGLGWLLVILALIAAGWYAYPMLQNHQAALAQFAGMRQAVDSVGDQVKQAAAKIEAQASDQQSLRDQVTKLGRTMQAKMETAAAQARESSAEWYARAQAQIDDKVKGVETRIGRLESSRDTQQTQLADLQRELGQTRREMAQQAEELTAVRQQMAQAGADQESQLARLKQNEESDRRDVDSIEHKLAMRRVDFEVTKNHSRELDEGISLCVTGTDVAHRAVSGWMWVMPDRRTIWLTRQSAQTPVIFYGREDGKKRELVVTNVTSSGVTGYLLLPGEQAANSSGSRSE